MRVSPMAAESGILADPAVRRLLAGLPDAVVGADRRARIVYANPAAERLLGWDAGTLVGEHLHAIQPERLHAQHDDAFERFAASGEGRLIGTPIRVPARRRDGTEVDIELSLASLRAPDAPAAGAMVIGFLRDLSERHELERQIEVTRMLRATAFRGATLTSLLDLDAVLRTVVETLVEDFGAALARVWLNDAETDRLLLRASAGLREETTTSPRAVIDPATYPYKVGRVALSRQAFISNALADDPEFDQEWVARQGIRSVACFPLLLGERLLGVFVLFARSPLRDEVVELLANFAALVSASIEDVRLLEAERAERSRAETAESRLRFLSQASVTLAGSLDYGATLAATARLAVPQLADWCVIDLLEDDELQMVGAAHADPAREPLIAELRASYPPDPAEPHVIYQVIGDGTPRLEAHIDDAALAARAHDARHLELLEELGIASHVVVPLVARGRTLGAISFIARPGGRTYGEADLELAVGLAERAAPAIDNARLYRAAREAIGLRDEFLSVASHELRTPVTVIGAYAQSLHRSVGRSDTPDAARIANGLAKIRDQAMRMGTLIDRLLDVTRLQSGEIPIEPRDTDLGALVGEIVDATRLRQAEGDLPASIRLELASTDDRPIIGQWDRSRLEQVVANLLDNAFKYSPLGGRVEVSIGRETEADGEVAHIVVRDEGIGIPEGQVEAIFEPFVRARNASIRHYAGLGMGLAVSREIVTRHGGRLWAESPGEERGSVFHVVLPLASSGHSQDRGTESTASPPPG